jgi:hypothetical protein
MRSKGRISFFKRRTPTFLSGPGQSHFKIGREAG